MEKKLKVLMVGPDRSVHGGISAVVNEYYNAGIDRHLSLRYIGTMKEGSKVKKLAVAAGAYVKFLFALPGARVVHVHMASDNSYRRKSLFINTAAFFGKPLVLHQHGGDVKNFYHNQLSEKGRAKMRKTLNRADLFLVLTPEWEAFFGDLVEPAKIQVLSNSIHIPDLPKKLYGQKKILFLGRICKDKGIRELFAVVERLHEKDPEVSLYMGGLFEDKELEAEAAKYPEFIHFLGWIGGTDKERILAECDIFVLPSYYEGQPVSVLEAMACACGVIATDVGGIPGMITDKETGLLIAPKDEAALEAALEELLSSPETCKRMGEKGRELTLEKYSIEKCLERLYTLYESLN